MDRDQQRFRAFFLSLFLTSASTLTVHRAPCRSLVRCLISILLPASSSWQSSDPRVSSSPLTVDKYLPRNDIIGICKLQLRIALHRSARTRCIFERGDSCEDREGSNERKRKERTDRAEIRNRARTESVRQRVAKVF